MSFKCFTVVKHGVTKSCTFVKIFKTFTYKSSFWWSSSVQRICSWSSPDVLLSCPSTNICTQRSLSLPDMKEMTILILFMDRSTVDDVSLSCMWNLLIPYKQERLLRSSKAFVLTAPYVFNLGKIAFFLLHLFCGRSFRIIKKKNCQIT